MLLRVAAVVGWPLPPAHPGISPCGDVSRSCPERRPARCRAVLVVAGLPRSGSTAQSRLLAHALHQLRQQPVDLGYWAWEQHARWNSSRRQWLLPTRAESSWTANWTASQWQRLQPSSLVTYKSHEFDGSLAHAMCDRSVVLLTSRCLEDMLGSWVRVGWAEPRLRSLRPLLLDAAAHYAMWKAVGALEIRHEEMRAHPEQAYTVILHYVALKLGLVQPAPRDAELPRTLIAEEANPHITSRVASAARVRSINKAVRKLRRRLQGTAKDPARFGLEWCTGRQAR